MRFPKIKNVSSSIVRAIFLALIFHGGVSGQDSQPNQWCEYTGKSGPGLGKSIVLISGDEEYRSEEALPMLGKILSKHHGFNCSVLFAINEDGEINPECQDNIPGMYLLETADLVILGLRFRNLPDIQMEYFDRYLQSGKPIIALRTSTHAFRIPSTRKYHRFSFDSKVPNWIGGFGQAVLGETWISHHGKHGIQSTRGVINNEFGDHSILKGVKNIWGPTDVYGIKHLPSTAQILVYGQVLEGMSPNSKPVAGSKNDPMMPVAWIRNHETEAGEKSKVFCTTMGAATDFQSDGFRRLIVNASYWALEMTAQISTDLETRFVGEFNPTNFGFGKFQKGKRPLDFALNPK